MSSQYLTSPPQTSEIPKGIPYIIGNEAAERFSFYGMKGILVVFMTKYLFLLPGSQSVEPIVDATAVEYYHLFTTAVYFTPLLGALLADIFLGKYMTILTLSLVYCAGHGTLALMGLSDSVNPWYALISGLFLISLGSGGIKPCVSAHVGDQFGVKNSHLLPKAFGWFYFSINTGAFLSTLMTPWLLNWYGPHLAFGIPGVLMAIATVLFWMGRKVFIHIPAGGAEWFEELKSPVGIGSLLKVSIVFIFIAVFWALFDQTGSSWVLQAEDMNRTWLGVTWLSSQIQAINPIMILIYIPIFQFVIYPLINSVWTLTPLRKISLGLFVMVGGFGLVALAQSWIDAGETPSIGWQILAYAVLTASEVMVSITGLEFAYTQAPKKMKSVIMALFLMSVSLGNFFTATVNHFIVVEKGAEVALLLVDDSWESQEDGYSFVYSSEVSADKANTIGYLKSDGALRQSSLTLADETVLLQARDMIGQFWDENDRLPLTEEGQVKLSGLTDCLGQPLRYQLLNSRIFHISSDGKDSLRYTSDDAWIEVSRNCSSEAEQRLELASGKSVSGEYTWIEKRKAELAVQDFLKDPNNQGKAAPPMTEFLPVRNSSSLKEVAKQEFSSDVTQRLGGATTLKGANYFWFFTQVMLGTAFLFMAVAYFYQPRTFIQGDDKDSESSSEAA